MRELARAPHICEGSLVNRTPECWKSRTVQKSRNIIKRNNSIALHWSITHILAEDVLICIHHAFALTYSSQSNLSQYSNFKTITSQAVQRPPTSQFLPISLIALDGDDALRSLQFRRLRELGTHSTEFILAKTASGLLAPSIPSFTRSSAYTAASTLVNLHCTTADLSSS